ncbi:MAG: type II toxin-antitoxin system VapC family toxin [Terriglobales bacterium]
MIILDTNILSELMRPLPAPEVTQWLDGLDEMRLVSTAITAWELLYGESLLPHGRRRQRLARDIQALLTEFAGRWMPFDVDAAREAADIQASCRRTGRPMEPRDLTIAAIARSRGATLATRNLRHFSGLGVELINPWAADLR